MADIVRIPFHGEEILSVRDERTGKEYVLPKHTCVTVFGLSWVPQYRKLTTNPDFTEGVTIQVIPSQSGDQEMLLLERGLFHAWLMSIDSRRIKDKGVQEQLQRYKKEATQALDAYWTKGIAINPRLDSMSTLRAMHVQIGGMLDQMEGLQARQSTQEHRQDEHEQRLLVVESRQPPAGKYTTKDFVAAYNKPRIDGILWKRFNQLCWHRERPEPFVPQGLNYPLNYYTVATLEWAFTEVTRQISFIREAPAPYGLQPEGLQ